MKGDGVCSIFGYLTLIAGASQHENIVDKVLMNAEAVKVAVINIFEGFTQSQDVGETIGKNLLIPVNKM